MNYKQYLVVIPGIVLAFVLYTLSQGFNNIVGIELLGYEKSPISTAMIAILFGMLFGNIFQMRDSFIKGLDFTQKYILKLGIICLGIQLKPFEFLEFGAIAIPLIIICIISVLIVIKLLVKKFKIPTRMAYLISIGGTVCGTTAIMATAPVIGAKKNEISYAIANITLFGILSMLIYDQQFNSPETMNIATVTKLIRNTFLVIMIPLFAYLYNRQNTVKKDYSIVSIFPYFVLGFVGMIIFRNVGDQVFLNSYNETWVNIVHFIKSSSKVFLTMAMAAIGLSTNLRDLKNMGYKPFVVGFIGMTTVGIVSIISIEFYINFLG